MRKKFFKSYIDLLREEVTSAIGDVYMIFAEFQFNSTKIVDFFLMPLFGPVSFFS